MLHLPALRRLLLLACLTTLSVQAQGGSTTVDAAFSRAVTDYDADTTPGGRMRTNTGRFFANPSVYGLDPGPFHGGASADTAAGMRWAMLYDQLARGSASASTPAPSLATLMSRASSWHANGRVPLTAVYWNYDYILPAAFNDNRMAGDSQGFYRPLNANGTPVNPASPYGTRTLVAATALTGPSRAPTEVLRLTSFVLPHNLLVLAPEATLTFVRVNFGDGAGYRTLALGVPVSVSYPTTGDKTVAVQIRVSDRGTPRTVTTRTTVRVVNADPPEETPGFASQKLANGASYCNYGSGLPEYDGCRTAGYRYAVWYANPAVQQLDKVIILTDGYDPPESRTRQDIFNDLNTRVGTQPSLAQTLRDQGYDIVVLDWDDSKDCIQRNAQALVKLIQTINADVRPRGGSIQAVVGFSMGGLISRYALLHMEQNGPAHFVHTFYSFDGAQQGGNIPLGLQYHVAHIPATASELSETFSPSEPSPRQIAYDFRRPATRQLLMVGMVAVEAGYGMLDPLRDALFEEIWTLGDYPNLVRRVAIVNGSGIGRSQSRSETDASLIRLNDHMVKQVFKTGVILQAAAISLEINSWTVPDRSSGIVEENVTRACTIWPLGCYSVLDRNTYRSPAGILPYDGSPGGYRDSQASLDDSIGDRPWWPAANTVLSAITLGGIDILDVDTEVKIERHSFIPTTSALDYAAGGQSRRLMLQGLFVNQNVLLNVGAETAAQRTARTPFDAYYLPGVTPSQGVLNQEHVTAPDPAIGAFFVQQLTLPVPNHTPPAMLVAIDGPSPATRGQSVSWTKSVQHGESPYTYRWGWQYVCGEGGPGEATASGGATTFGPTYPCNTQYRDGGTSSYLTITPPDSGNLRITLTVTDATGNAEIASKMVFVAYSGSAAAISDGTGPTSARLAADLASAPLPTEYALGEAAPNPFGGTTIIRYSLPEHAMVHLTIHDLLGREVARLADGPMDAGVHAARFDGARLPVGVYLVRFQAEGATGTASETQRVTLTR